MIKRSVGGVDVFGLVVRLEGAGAECDRFESDIEDCKGQSVAESIVVTALIALDNQTSFLQVLFRQGFLFGVIEESIPAVESVAELELFDNFIRQLASLEILKGLSRVPQVFGEKSGSDFVGIIELIHFLGVAVIRALRQRDIGFRGQELKRVRERHFLEFHNEREDVTPLVAAETVVDLLVRGDGKRRGLLVMKWAFAPVVAPFALEREVSRNHFDNVRCFSHLFDDVITIECHGKQ